MRGELRVVRAFEHDLTPLIPHAAERAWKEKFAANIVDLGGKLAPGGKIMTASDVTDGPFIEAKELIGGYMIIAPTTTTRRSRSRERAPA